MTKIRVRILTHIDEDGEGYHASAPALRGCHAGGMTIEEARGNLDDAIQLHLAALVERGVPLPIGCEADVIEEQAFDGATIHFEGVDPGRTIRANEELDLLIPA